MTIKSYPELFAVVGSSVPDYRGYFLRGVGGNSNALGIEQGDAIRNIVGSFYGFHTSGGSNAFSVSNVTHPNSFSASRHNSWYEGSITFNASKVVPTAEENRPINKSVRYMIRALP